MLYISVHHCNNKQVNFSLEILFFYINFIFTINIVKTS